MFWHQPQPGVDDARYERALLEFQHRAADICLGSRTYRVAGLPWMPGGGYEDWYLVEDFAALGRLNAAAVDSDHAAAHDVAAGLAGFGAAGLYRLIEGDPAAVRSHHLWSVSRVGADGAVWQRQMVLSVAPEWCGVGAAGTPVEVLVG